MTTGKFIAGTVITAGLAAAFFLSSQQSTDQPVSPQTVGTAAPSAAIAPKAEEPQGDVAPPIPDGNYSISSENGLNVWPRKDSNTDGIVPAHTCVTVINGDTAHPYAHISFQDAANGMQENVGWVLKEKLEKTPECSAAPASPRPPDLGDMAGKYYRLRLKTFFTPYPAEPDYFARDEISIPAGQCVLVEVGRTGGHYALATHTWLGDDKPDARGWVIMSHLDPAGCK